MLPICLPREGGSRVDAARAKSAAAAHVGAADCNAAAQLALLGRRAGVGCGGGAGEGVEVGRNCEHRREGGGRDREQTCGRRARGM